MEKDKELIELDELTQEIKKTIQGNRQFLARVMDDDFEPDEEPAETEEASVES